MRDVSLKAVDPLGNTIVVYDQTLAQHRIKHKEPFSNEDIVDCIEAPNIIAKSGHTELAHKERLVYYKDKDYNDGGPNIMKVIADHADRPGVATSMFRTDHYTQDGVTVYIDPEYIKRSK